MINSSYTVDELRATLTARRDAMTAAIAALDLAFAAMPVITPPVSRRLVQRGKVAKAKPAKRRKAADSGLSSDPQVKAREEAILLALQRNDGIATAKILRAAMPKEPALSAEQRGDAYRNCLYRLKSKGVIGRTGDTWSLVGIGSAR